MASACPDELVCDMAETYGIYNWRALPLATAATLAQGLPPTSRTARKITGAKCTDVREILLAVVADRIGHLIWMISDDGRSGANHPPSLLEKLTGSEEIQVGYESAEDFDAAWAAITGGEENA